MTWEQKGILGDIRLGAFLWGLSRKGELMGKDLSPTTLVKLEETLVKLNRWCIGGMLGVMFLLVFTNVVTRYCLGFSIAVAEEISTFLMIWVTYLGAGLALREGKLASIDALQDRLPPLVERPVRIFLGIVIVAFFTLLAFTQCGLFPWDGPKRPSPS